MTCDWGHEARESGLIEYVDAGVVVVQRFKAGLSSAVSDVSSPCEHCEIEPFSRSLNLPTTALSEALLKKFTCLTLTKVCGDVVVAAGPMKPSELPQAADEALRLVAAAQGHCTSVVALGSFYAVVTAGTPSFFLLGDAIYAAKLMLQAAPPHTTVYSDEFKRRFFV